MLLSPTSSVCTRCALRLQRLSISRSGQLVRKNAAPKRYNSHAVTSSRPIRIAVVGSGPAGFYTAYRLMSKVENTFVDMYEQLPVPFGLVRFGVAPDHPEVKNCQDKFTEVAESPRFNFIGNIALGTSLSLTTLTPHYDAILFTYGASQDRALGIPGEDTAKGVYSARAFVGWYNGLPEYRDLAPDLQSGEDAVIIGQGNVALDVARVLLSPVDALRKTDMTEYALETLSRSKINRVRVVGRRGPLQAAFTIKELRELLQIPAVSFDHVSETLLPPPDVAAKLPRAQKRILQLLQKGSATPSNSSTKSWSLDFLLSPSEIHTSASGQITNLTLHQNTFDTTSDPFSPSARVTPSSPVSTTTLPTSALFRSIGYKSAALPGFSDLGIPFDNRRGTIPHDGQGRIVADPSPPSDPLERRQHQVLSGLYSAGWVKNGPTGVIATTMADAFGTADAIVADIESKKEFLGGRLEDSGLKAGWEGVKVEAEKLGLRRVSWEDWKIIDRVEREKGEAKGKIREKFGSIEEMLEVLD